MCRRVTCSVCNKQTFAGCGMHVEQVLGDVPREQRCRCNEEAGAKKSGASAAPSPADGPGWWSKLFGG